ncbi:MAG TPA: SUF system Fe-S cluster assembly regulator [Azospirillaceae bacterium]|nr:SUF system Fe-S cluster assembly regulator [Azospirillaceae bacterium]
MLRLSKLTDYAVVVMTEMLRTPTAVMTAGELAARTGLPAPTVQKILKLLAKDGLMASTRGASGGYALARPAAHISVADIIAAVDGPIALTDCVGGAEGCCVEELCPMRGNWDKVNRAVRAALEGVSLADMASPSAPEAPAQPRQLAHLPG